nr:acyl carrier protein [Streptomyces sp. SID7805]
MLAPDATHDAQLRGAAAAGQVSRGKQNISDSFSPATTRPRTIIALKGNSRPADVWVLWQLPCRSRPPQDEGRVHGRDTPCGFSPRPRGHYSGISPPISWRSGRIVGSQNPGHPITVHRKGCSVITAEEVCVRIAKKLGSKANSYTLNEDTAFDSVGLSSLQIADIVYTIEDDLEIEFDESKAASVKTVADLVKLAEETQQGSAAA